MFERSLAFRDEDKPAVLFTSTFDVMDEQFQKMIGGRERQYTPLLNHIHDTVVPVFASAFLTEGKASRAFTRFEVIMATSFAHINSNREMERFGESSENYTSPPTRLVGMRRDENTTVKTLIQEAKRYGATWAPVRDGLFDGKADRFIQLAEIFEQQNAKRGFGW